MILFVALMKYLQTNQVTCLVQSLWLICFMKVLLTGATGYIGKRLLPVLVKHGYKVVCGVRDASRFHAPRAVLDKIEVVEMDLLDRSSLEKIPDGIEGAYYLVHSMSSSSNYENLELQSAINFREAMSTRGVKHVIYLSGIANDQSLSKHLGSRLKVEKELAKGSYHLTTLRAGIIIGSGSASYEIVRDLVEKLPVMITPKWLNTKCQPIAISDVVNFLHRSLLNDQVYDQNFDIGGPDVLSYKEMLLELANLRGFKRYIFVVPVMTPRLSSYWLYFITATSYKLAVALVDSMKVEVVCRDTRINDILEIQPISYKKSLLNTFRAIDQNQIISSWKDALVSGDEDFKLSDFIQVPTHGCFIDHRSKEVKDIDITLDKIMSIGGVTGWYYANWLWRLRGFLDKLAGGVGLRRGRTSVKEIAAGDVIDFWRVLHVSIEERRLLLLAEMKLPGEAWLEFRMNGNILEQTATFRPHGLWGRLYWYAVLPFHGLIFTGLLRKLCE